MARQPEVADVAGSHEHVRLEQVADAALAGLEGEGSVHVQAAGPVQAAAQRIAIRARANTSEIESTDAQGSA